MQTLRGKYNIANVMIDEIEENTKTQILTFLDHPAFKNTYIAIMPDCHAGNGVVIGFTMKMNDYIIPNIIGVDIGCGMLTAIFDKIEPDLAKLDNYIKDHIPAGFAINSDYQNVNSLQIEEVAKVCVKIGIDSHKALKAIGSLGGGNHFIEAGYNQSGNFCLTIHSGSRNFGKCVAEFYQRKAREILDIYLIDNKFKHLEYLPVATKEAQEYLEGLAVAQRFAASNRREMLNRIMRHLGCNPVEIIESVHNFIGDDQIIRKGATPARAGEKVIIPFNMRDGIALCTGKGSAKYNFSAPHGAGRIMSRIQAKKQLSLADFQREMKNAGVFTTTAVKETLDEAPGAYKDKELIIANIAETVEIYDFIKPVYNFKAGGE